MIQNTTLETQTAFLICLCCFAALHFVNLCPSACLFLAQSHWRCPSKVKIQKQVVRQISQQGTVTLEKFSSSVDIVSKKNRGMVDDPLILLPDSSTRENPVAPGDTLKCQRNGATDTMQCHVWKCIQVQSRPNCRWREGEKCHQNRSKRQRLRFHCTHVIVTPVQLQRSFLRNGINVRKSHRSGISVSADTCQSHVGRPHLPFFSSMLLRVKCHQSGPRFHF